MPLCYWDTAQALLIVGLILPLGLLLGLLGTVIGMIRFFKNLASGTVKTEALISNIDFVLNASGTGFIIFSFDILFITLINYMDH